MLVSFVNYETAALFSSLDRLIKLLETGNMKIITLLTLTWAFFEKMKTDDNLIFKKI